MRLIDADNIISVCEILSEKGNDPHYWNQLISIIKDMPTIDAIPVEWLWQTQDKMLKMPQFTFEECAVIGKLIRAWQKEQEAI